MKQIQKVNLGGGNKRIAGYTNIDILPLPEVDMVCDITKGLPLQDNSIDEILAYHIIEHIPDSIALFEELYRVCKHNALIRIKVPYFKSIGAFKDPTHVSFFTERTFEYFDPDNNNLPDYHINAHLKTERLWFSWSHPWMRLLPFKRMFFMNYFWNIAQTMCVHLRVVKPPHT